jgi:carnitine 3-dehydrogenase
LLKNVNLFSKENNMRPDPQHVRVVTSIGAGPIGGGWAAFFLARGYQVRAYLHSMKEEKAFRSILDTAWPCLVDLGLAEGASLSNLTITDNLEDAVAGTEFVQESAPERLEIKQELYAQLGEIVPPEVVIASSTSGLPMSDIQARCSSPERTVVGHPFNPPYLLPLVEVVGGRLTTSDALYWVMEFYRIAGKEPLLLKKEIPGFIATRLQEALWREALHMVANGEASPEDIDRALRFGPAPRMAIQGQCMAFHVACGEGGMATNLDQFGPALKLPWTRLEAPELTTELRNAMVEGCNAMAGDRHFEDMAAERDRRIVAVIKAARGDED